MFTDRERAYLSGSSLARLATTATDGQPDVAVLAYRFQNDQFIFWAARGRRTLRARNISNGNVKVAIVVDDLPDGARPGEGKARGIKIHGVATFEVRDGQDSIVVTPTALWSWGIEQPTDHTNPAAMRRVPSSSL